MRTYNVHEAKTHFSAILAHVTAGEEVIVAKAGKPVAIISPFREPSLRREFGPFRGQVKIEDSFFEPMDDDFMQYFR